MDDKFKCLNFKQEYYQGDEQLFGFDSIDFFKLMSREDHEGNEINYQFKELVYEEDCPRVFLDKASEYLLEQFDEWRVSTHLTSFMNIEIGTDAKDLHLRDLLYLREIQKVLFKKSLLWSVNYTLGYRYRIQLILPICQININ